MNKKEHWPKSKTGRPICDGSNASSVAFSTRPCGTLYGPFGGYDGWWFWRRRHHQLGSYLGRIPSELAWSCRPAEEVALALLLVPNLRTLRSQQQQATW